MQARQGPRSGAGGDAARVLFVSHEATRTGAPVMFLNFLRWLRAHTALEFDVLLLAGGPLVPEFAAVAPTTLVEARGRSRASYVEAGIARAGFPQVSDKVKTTRTQRAARALTGYDAVYINSATAALALRILPQTPPVVLSHIHELDGALAHWFPEPDRRALLTETRRFIACADAVTRCLVDTWGVPSAAVARHYEFIEPPPVAPTGAAAARRALGIPAGARVVGGAGSVGWRKAPDLFLQVAARMVRTRPDLDLHFLWVGGESGGEVLPVDHDVRRLGLEDRVHLAGEVPDPGDLFATFDVFVLPSREDPYPLVMLEAAALGVPVVAFANGGVVEFAGPVDDPAGRRAVVVPYLDVAGLAGAAVALLDDDDQRRALGQRGRDHVLGAHTVAVAAAPLYHEILDALADHGSPPARRWAAQARREGSSVAASVPSSTSAP